MAVTQFIRDLEKGGQPGQKEADMQQRIIGSFASNKQNWYERVVPIGTQSDSLHGLCEDSEVQDLRRVFQK